MSIKRIWAEKRIVIAFLIAATAVNVGLLAFGVLPVKKRLQSSDDQINSALQERAQQEINFKSSQNRILLANRARKDLDEFYKTVLPSSAKVAREILYKEIGARASAEQLVLERRLIRREQAVSEISRLSRLEATIRLSGSYGRIRGFIDRIEKADAFVVIDNLTLEPRINIDSGTLVLNMRLSTYFLNKETES